MIQTDKNHYKSIEFTCRFERTATLPPLMGSALRGVLGNALMKMYCTEKVCNCKACEKSSTCLFVKLFKRLDTSGKVPYELPSGYVINCPLISQKYFSVSENFYFELKLFSCISEYAREMIQAFELGLKSGLTVNRVPVNIIDVKTSQHYILSDFPQNSNIVKLTFDMPLRLKTNKEGVLWEVGFDSIIANITRRLEEMVSLATAVNYGTSGITLVKSDVKPFFANRYSNRTGVKGSVSGLVGSVIFKGDNLSEFAPMINAGTVLHIGKMTSMGLGHYNVEWDKI